MHGKKADIGWEYIAKIILMLIFLFVLIGIIMLLSGKSFSVIERIKQLLRF